MKKFAACLMVFIYGVILSGGARIASAEETKAGAGALVGGLLGAVAGGAIGKKNHNTTGGALIGGAVGALSGAAIGSTMKSQPAAAPAAVETAEPAASLPSASTSSKVTMKQIIYWTGQGLPSDEIIARIQKSGTIFALTQDDIDYLHKQKVSVRVIEAMQGE